METGRFFYFAPDKGYVGGMNESAIYRGENGTPTEEDLAEAAAIGEEDHALYMERVTRNLQRELRRLDDSVSNDGVYGAWGYDQDFKISTLEPSVVVKKAVEGGLISRKSRVLDLGCGQNPRNAVFLARQLACQVDGVDLEKVTLPSGLPPSVIRRLHLKVGPVMDYDLGETVYQTTVMARLIQYLSPEEMETLITKVGHSLDTQGVLLLSYTAAGGILNKTTQYKIDGFSHPIELVKSVLTRQNFKIISLIPGTPRSTNVPHSGEKAVTYDITARKQL